MRALAILLGSILFAMVMFATPVLATDFQLSDADHTCPSGYQLMTVQEATANKAKICQQLGQWDIRRLAGGGSMDGSGYDCKIRSADERALGGSICMVARSASCYWMQSAPPYAWLPAPQGDMSKAQCFNLDSCDGGKGMSGGGCYK